MTTIRKLKRFAGKNINKSVGFIYMCVCMCYMYVLENYGKCQVPSKMRYKGLHDIFLKIQMFLRDLKIKTCT